MQCHDSCRSCRCISRKDCCRSSASRDCDAKYSDGKVRPPETANSAVAVTTTVAKSVGDCEARPPGIAKYVATSKSKSELAELPDELHDEAGRSWPRSYGMTSACLSAVTTSVGEARPPGFVTAESEPELAESSDEDSSSKEDEAGSSWSRASCTTCTAATTAVAKSAGEVRPLVLAKRTESRQNPNSQSLLEERDRLEANIARFME